MMPSPRTALSAGSLLYSFTSSRKTTRLLTKFSTATKARLGLFFSAKINYNIHMEKTNLAKNTTYFTAALTVQKILAFIYFWFIANSLFPGQLGQYIFALSFTTLFSIFIDLGLSPVLTREAAKSKDRANLYLKNVIGLKIPLAIITLIVAWLVINITGKEAAVRLLVYLASVIMILDSFSLSFWVIFRARRTLKY